MPGLRAAAGVAAAILPQRVVQVLASYHILGHRVQVGRLRAWTVCLRQAHATRAAYARSQGAGCVLLWLCARHGLQARMPRPRMISRAVAGTGRFREQATYMVACKTQSVRSA